MNKPPQGYVKQTTHNELKRQLAEAIEKENLAEWKMNDEKERADRLAERACKYDTAVDALNEARREIDALRSMWHEALERELESKM